MWEPGPQEGCWTASAEEDGNEAKLSRCLRVLPKPPRTSSVRAILRPLSGHWNPYTCFHLAQEGWWWLENEFGFVELFNVTIESIGTFVQQTQSHICFGVRVSSRNMQCCQPQGPCKKIKRTTECRLEGTVLEPGCVGNPCGKLSRSREPQQPDPFPWVWRKNVLVLNCISDLFGHEPVHHSKSDTAKQVTCSRTNV